MGKVSGRNSKIWPCCETRVLQQKFTKNVRSPQKQAISTNSFYHRHSSLRSTRCAKSRLENARTPGNVPWSVNQRHKTRVWVWMWGVGVGVAVDVSVNLHWKKERPTRTHAHTFARIPRPTLTLTSATSHADSVTLIPKLTNKGIPR